MLYLSHLLSDSEMKEILDKTGMGVESIEFSVAENLDSLEECLISYGRRLEAMGCSDLTLHGPFLDLNPMAYDREIRRVTRLRYEQAYYAAKKLGAKKIVYHTCFLPKIYLPVGIADRMADFFREFLEDKDDSVEILMENVLDEVPEPLKEAAQKIRHPAFHLCLDLGHAHCYGKKTVREWADTLAPFVTHVHLHDNDGSRDSHSGLGKGTVPILEALEGFLADGKRRTYTLECGCAEDVWSSWEFLRKNNRNLLTKEAGSYNI